MVKHMIKQASKTHQDSKERCITRFTILGMKSGFRGAEWVQKKKVPHSKRNEHGAFDLFDEHPDKPVYALMESDLTFKTWDNKIISDPLNHPLKQIGFITVRHRVQKNRINGQKVTHAADKENKDLCPVRAGIEILQQAKRLGIRKDIEPLAAYKQNQGSRHPTWLSSAQVSTFFRTTAREVYDIPDDMKAEYTPHSLRIGATVILHTAGAAPDEIKFKIRWSSGTYRAYLRDVTQAAKNHLQYFQHQVNLLLQDEPALVDED